MANEFTAFGRASMLRRDESNGRDNVLSDSAFGSDSVAAGFLPPGGLESFATVYNPGGSETLVNQVTAGAQIAPRITYLTDGKYVVTWQTDQGVAPTEISARIFNADGTAFTNEFAVNTTTAGNQVTPDIAALAGGGFVAVWGSTPGFSADIRASVFDANGVNVTAGGEVEVNDAAQAHNPLSNQATPVVIGLTGGRFAVTWTDLADGTASTDGSNTSIRTRVFNADGTPFSAETLVNTQAALAQRNPAIATLGTGYVVVWQDGSNASGQGVDIRAQRYDLDGVKVGTEILVTSTAITQESPAVVELLNGTFVIAWTDFSGTGGDASGSSIKARVISAEGVPIGVEFLINVTSSSNQSDVSLARLADGGFVASWNDSSQSAGDTNAFAVRSRAFDATGVQTSAERLINTTTTASQWFSAVAADASGNYTIAFRDDSSGSGDIRFQRFEATFTNDAPAGTDATLTIDEDAPRILATADFGYGDPIDGNAFAGVVLTTLPTSGALSLNGTAITVAGTFVTAAQIAANELVYTPAANANGAGAASFTFQVRDDGGTANGGVDTDQSANTLTFDVTAQNDAPAFSAPTFAITRVSTNGAGAQVNGASATPVFSPDGTKVAFSSLASSLVAGDTNGSGDIFVKDLATGTVTRVSTSAAGAEAASASTTPVFSPDGTKIAFVSAAANLVAGDTNNLNDVFVKDLVTGMITRVSTNGAGAQVNGASATPVFSPDGAKIAFVSAAADLVAGDTNNQQDVFVKDLATGAVTRVSTGAGGAQATGGFSNAPIFSPDGTKIAFVSAATDLVSGDTNGFQDIFVKDLTTGAITRVSTDGVGTQSAGGNSSTPVFSSDGTKLLFASAATNLVAGDTNNTQDIFVKDLLTGAVTRVSTDSVGAQSNNFSSAAVFSPDATKVAFSSAAGNLVPGNHNTFAHIYVKDLQTGAIIRVSTDSTGAQGSTFSLLPSFSPDGASVAFASAATNLVSGDTNSQQDIFVATIGGVTPTFTENGAAVPVATVVNVGDVDSANYAGGTFGATLTAGSVAGDVLSLASTGGATGIDVVGSSVRYNNVEIGVLTTTATGLSVALDADATDAAVEALAEAVRFSSTSDNPTSAARTITFTLTDGGGTADSGADTASFTRSVNVTPQNDAPAGTDKAIAVDENAPYTFSAADFGFTDVDGNALAAVVINTLPTAGALTLSGATVAAGQVITAANIPNLVFTADETGAATPSFTFQVRDDGAAGGANQNVDQSANTLTLNVTAQNDAPVFTDGLVVSRVSTASDGSQENNNANAGAIFSPDGTKIFFTSSATNLVAGDTNGQSDVFMKDLATGAVTRISVSQAGAQDSGGVASKLSVSADGNLVAFASPGGFGTPDTSGQQDVFIKNLTTGAVTLVSVTSGGVQPNSLSSDPVLSPDGTKILFTTLGSGLNAGDTNGLGDLYLKDLITGTITWISQGPGGVAGSGAVATSQSSQVHGFSPDGTKILFQSAASNLVTGDTNGQTDLFVRDLTAGTTTRVSTDSAGGQAVGGFSGNAIFSPDGSKILFTSAATNLVAGDTNAQTDIFIKDLATGAVTRISVDAAGAQTNGFSTIAMWSPDGTKVAFYSNATNLVAGDTNGQTDVFVKDLLTGGVTQVSVNTSGLQGNGQSTLSIFSPDSQSLLFASNASNLVPGDTNARQDIFLARLPGPVDPVFVEGGAAIAVASRVHLSDADSADFGGGSLTVAISAGNVAGDRLTIASTGANTGIDIVGTSVRYNGVEIGVLTASATSFSVALDADANAAAIEALAEAVRFDSTSDAPGSDPRTVTFTLDDGDGGASSSTSFDRFVVLAAVNDEPAGTDDADTVLDNAILTLSTSAFASGFSDVDGDAFAGVRITTLPATGTLKLNGSDVVAGDDVTLADLDAGLLTYEPAAGSGNTTPTFTFQVRDNGGTANGGVDLDQSPNTFTIDVQQSNALPVLDLNGAEAGTGISATVVEDVGGLVAPDAVVTDSDSANFDGGTLTVSYGAGRTASDFVSVQDQSGQFAMNNRIGVGFNFGTGKFEFYYNTVLIGTAPAPSPGLDLVVTFNANATPAAAQALVRAVTTGNLSDTPPAGARPLTFTLTDGDGGTSSAIAEITVTAVDDDPVNTVPAGTQSAIEDSDFVFSVANGNAITISDPDSASITVTLSVANGNLTLATTQGLTFTGGDGGPTGSMTFSGSQADINAALDGLVYRADLNFNGSDTLNIATSDGGPLQSSAVAIDIAADNQIDGDGGDNNLDGTPQSDFFDLTQGGNDNVDGLAGNDGFYFGGAYNVADVVDGGIGNRDQIGLQGDYTAPVTLGSLIGVELVVLLPGDDARFGGQTGTNLTYSLIADANTIVSDNKLTIQANSLRAGETLVFDGSASSIDFLIYAGLGTDSLTGGSGNDGFFFGDGRLSATDVVNGGAGTMDQLGLQGNYSGPNAVTFGASQLSGLEFIVLLSASDNRFGSNGGTVGYNLTMNNANVGVGQTLIVSANTLQVNEGLVFDGSAETDGAFQIFSGAGSDSLVGGQRGDDLRGGASLDYIRGLGGADILYGGAGNDNFEYVQASDSTAAARDRIMDFGGRDSIDLGFIAFLTGDSSAFTFIGNGPQTGARQLQVIQTGSQAIVNLFIDADATADLVIEVNIADGQTLTVEDFNGATAPVPQAPLGKAAGAATPDKLGVDGFDGGYLRSDLSNFTSSLPDIVAVDVHGLGGTYDLLI